MDREACVTVGFRVRNGGQFPLIVFNILFPNRLRCYLVAFVPLGLERMGSELCMVRQEYGREYGPGISQFDA
jgi:hypothetical protein